MTFPLGDWIELHRACRHNLGISGMVGAVPAFSQRFRRRGRSTESELRQELARLVRVAPDRLCLTHGATEANSTALLYLNRKFSRIREGAPTCWLPTPEYPPLRDTAALVGFAEPDSKSTADVTAMSNPNNPSGIRLLENAVRDLSGDSDALLVDETFREFTVGPSLQESRIPGLWTTGSFTKVYGADAIRVGFIVCPEDESTSFRRFHGLLLDELPSYSVSAALGILDHRNDILKVVRSQFQKNVRSLRSAVVGIPQLHAPLWFDRGNGALPGDLLANEALQSSVLVCPGSFFGEKNGVRICLTRRTFAHDLEAYLRVRSRWTDRKH